jgi:hypothetical protein
MRERGRRLDYAAKSISARSLSTSSESFSARLAVAANRSDNTRAHADGNALDSVRYATTAAVGTYLSHELEGQELGRVTGEETQTI